MYYQTSIFIPIFYAVDHSWLLESDEQDQNRVELNPDVGTSDEVKHLMSRDQDISFGTGSHIMCDAQSSSPAFSCKSSFSSFLVSPSTPHFTSGAFSFRSCGSSSSLEFCSPIPSMPSFTFFSSGLSNCQDSSVDLSSQLSLAEIIVKGRSILSVIFTV